MADESKSIGEIYAERARQERPEASPPSSTQPSTTTIGPSHQTGPIIYGGNPPSSDEEFLRQSIAARNKSIKPRKQSPFNLMVTMILFAIAVVLYVGNVIAVQQLLKDVSDRQAHLQQILNDQEVLKAQINRMSSLERIRTMAEGELGLHNPNGPSQWIEVDASKIQEIDRELSSQQPVTQKAEK